MQSSCQNWGHELRLVALVELLKLIETQKYENHVSIIILNTKLYSPASPMDVSPFGDWMQVLLFVK